MFKSKGPVRAKNGTFKTPTFVHKYTFGKRFNRTQMLLFAVLFAIGGYIIIRSFAASTSPVVTGQDFFGVNMGHMEWGNFSRAQVDAALADVKSGGAHWIRMNAQWSDIQAGGPTSWNWVGTDKVIDSANAHGLKVLATLTYSPKWALASQYQNISSKGQYEIYEPANVNDYANFAKAAAQRYAAKGVHYYEIWNEANCYFWKPSPNAAHYTNLLKAAYSAIKSVDPSAVVISSGLAPYGSYPAVRSDGSCINPLKFLQDMYANGAKNYMDAIGWHPYNWSSGSPSQNAAWNGFYEMYGTSPSVVSIMNSNGDSKKIWMTEFGYPVGNDSEGSAAVTHNNEPLQGQYLTEGYNLAVKSSWAGPIFWYNYQDGAFGTSESFGLNRSDGSHRPAWSAFQTASNNARNSTPPPPPSVDTTAPNAVSVLLPKANDTVTGSFNFDGGASDNVGVTKMQYFVDNNSVGNATASIYGWVLTNWNSKSVSDGTHKVFVRAFDAAGNHTDSQPVSFSVKNSVAPQPPTVSIVVPHNGDQLCGKTWVSASTTTSSAITRVDYFANGNFIGSAQVGLYGAPFNWDTSTVKDGSYTLTAKAYDSNNLSATSPTVSVSVANTACLLQILSATNMYIALPHDNDTVSGTATLDAGANYSNNITTVDYYLNGSTYLGRAQPTIYGYIYWWDTTKVANGSYQLTVKGTNSDGHIYTSQPVTVNVSNTAPVTKDSAAPTPPTNLHVSAKTDTTVSLAWNPGTDDVGITSYHIYVNTKLYATTPNTSIKLSGLKANTQYNIAVAAFDAVGNRSPGYPRVYVTTYHACIGTVCR